MAHLRLAIPSSSMRPSPAFNLPSSDSSDSGDDAPLPFPAALPRSDFLASDFQPAAYLSALPPRHQTLEDLRADLRERTAAISSELLELVNSNYIAFLSLGSELEGGDDKIGDVKMSLLGFRRAVEEAKGKVTARRKETESLTNELREVRSDIEEGRKMLELSERLSALEEKLALEGLPRANGDQWDDDDSSDGEAGQDDQAKGLVGIPSARMLAWARECTQLTSFVETLNENHPFTPKLRARLSKCQDTLLLDLNNALREARQAGSQNHNVLLGYLAIYRVLGAESDAIKTLRRRR